MIDILIPTYNRICYLLKNLRLLEAQLSADELSVEYRVLISDNCSPDGTYDKVLSYLPGLNLTCEVFKQSENCGPEKNCLFLLSQSKADFFLYLGDDDYLPSGYLKYLVRQVNSIPSLSCVIPGYSVLETDGTLASKRPNDIPERQYLPGFKSALALSHYGHQLSGILCRRDGLLERYMANEKLRNLYPFIYFVAFNSLRGTVYYAPIYSVIVTITNSKDWKYDDSGLLTEVTKNYKILYPRNVFKRGALDIYFMYIQRWRIYVGNNFSRTWRGFRSIFFSEYVSFFARLMLPAIYMLIWTRNRFSCKKI